MKSDDTKTLQGSRSLAIILAYLNNAVVWIVSFLPSISISSGRFQSLWGQFQVLQSQLVLRSPSRSANFLVLWQMPKFLSFFSLALIFTQFFAVTTKSILHIFIFFFFLIIIWLCLLNGIRLSVGISKSQRILFILFFRADSGLCFYHLVAWSNFNFWYYS